MSLNPQDRKQWHGFLDLMQPPEGYRLRAALGTTFGLSFDALVAALLAMCDADGEEVAANPVAATIAISRLSSKVRVLVHPATVSGGTTNSGTTAFVSLLDRLIVEVEPEAGLFHPKVWALRFEHIGPARQGKPSDFGRVLIGSRNLGRSSSFELGAVFDSAGEPASERGSALGADVEKALREWLDQGGASYPKPVGELPKFFGRLNFDVPREAEKALRLRRQGLGQAGLMSALPTRMRRAVLVSPFIQSDFLAEVVSRTEALNVVSLPQSLDLLPDSTIDLLDELATRQGSPVLYQVTQHGDPDDAVIDGIHAKMLVVEGNGGETVTFVGSANATGPGWGLISPANVEAVVEMRPGLDLDRFFSHFVRESKTKVHPWVAEYSRESRADEDQDHKAEREMLAALREVAKVSLRLNYDQKKKQLTLSSAAKRRALPRWVAEGRAFSVAPMGLLDVAGSWRSLDEVLKGTSKFEEVDVAQLTAFVVLRGQNEEPSIQCQRLVIAELVVPDALLDDRDELVRARILETADPAVVLNALIRGLAHVPSYAEQSGAKGRKHEGLSKLLEDVSLERLLHAVALDRSLVGEIRKLLAPFYGDEVLRLCDDLDEVVKQVYEGEPA